MRLLPWLVFLPPAVVAVIPSCGPSVQSVYESNVRFEHCYRLDLDREIAPSHRLTCWREWSRRYTYGQTRDRLEHAKKRVRALETGETSPPGLNLSGADAAAKPSAPAEAIPTSIHAPPPATVAQPVDAGPADGQVEAAAPTAARPPPGKECADECRTTWKDCINGCPDGATSKLCQACEVDYKKCMKRCFK